MKKKEMLKRYNKFAQAYIYLIAVSFDLSQKQVLKMIQAHNELGIIIMALQKTSTKKEIASLHKDWLEKMRNSLTVIPCPIPTALDVGKIVEALNNELKIEGGFLLASVEPLP